MIWRLALLGVVLSACNAPARAPLPAPAPTPACPPPPAPVPAPPPAVARAPIAEVQSLLRSIDATRMMVDVQTLAAFGTRHTLSDTASPTRGIGAARRWVEARMRQAATAGSAVVSVESHTVHPDGKRVAHDVDVVNVLTTRPGTSPTARDRRVYVVAHLDSRRTDVMDAAGDAPGANDDASGVAVVLALADALSRTTLDSTLVLLVTSGEEQGLLGAKAHVSTLAGADVRGVLNDDIVGDPAGGDPHVVRVFSDGPDDGSGRELARFVGETAAREALELTPELVLRADRVLRGGDHLPFTAAGFPAVRLTASAEDYTRQHQDVRVEGGVHYGDTPDHVDPAYLAAMARLNLAVAVHLANAPDAPPDAHLVAELSRDARLRWSASRDPDVAGYEVVWRATTSATWEHARDVGRALEVRLPISKDDSFFGVRAYDAAGYRSPVAFARPVAP